MGQIEEIIQAAIDCPHRITLLKKSQEFKPERVRLGRILADSNKLGFKNKGQIESLLKKFLQV